MNPEMAKALIQDRQRELSRTASKRAVPGAREPLSHVPGRRTPAWRVPRYRVSWSRTTLAGVAAGRRGRSWVIVISATRGL